MNKKKESREREEKQEKKEKLFNQIIKQQKEANGPCESSKKPKKIL